MQLWKIRDLKKNFKSHDPLSSHLNKPGLFY